MNKIFLDTNILLDYYLNRPGADAAEQVFEKAYTGKIILCASTLTFAFNLNFGLFFDYTIMTAFSLDSGRN